MKFDLMSIVLMISTSFLISLNAQTEAGEDTLKIPQGQQIKPALDAITQDRQNRTALDPLDLEIDEIILDEKIYSQIADDIFVLCVFRILQAAES